MNSDNLGTQKIIKTKPLKQEVHFYEIGDILLGKCINHPYWPCIIKNFCGYDQEEVQVYYVQFLACNQRAYLQTYRLTRVTKTKLKNIKTKYIYKSNFNYRRSVKVAEVMIKSIQLASRKNEGLTQRFIRLYCQDKAQYDNFYDVEQLRLQTQSANKQKIRQQKMNKMQINQINGISIDVSTIADMYFKSILSTKGEILSSMFKKQKTENRMAHEQRVQINIKNWKPTIFQSQIQ